MLLGECNITDISTGPKEKGLIYGSAVNEECEMLPSNGTTNRPFGGNIPERSGGRAGTCCCRQYQACILSLYLIEYYQIL